MNVVDEETNHITGLLDRPKIDTEERLQKSISSVQTRAYCGDEASCTAMTLLALRGQQENWLGPAGVPGSQTTDRRNRYRFDSCLINKP